MAAATAAAGGGGSMIQDMPDFSLVYLVFLLAHHPDFPTQEVNCGCWPGLHFASARHDGLGGQALW
jgi:hypothetical protein